MIGVMANLNPRRTNIDNKEKDENAPKNSEQTKVELQQLNAQAIFNIQKKIREKLE